MRDDIQEKIKKLPHWAREHIHFLKIRAEPQTEEIVRLWKRVEDLEQWKRLQQDRINAMVAMFQCAAKGENEIAKAVQRIVEDFLISE